MKRPASSSHTRTLLPVAARQGADETSNGRSDQEVELIQKLAEHLHIDENDLEDDEDWFEFFVRTAK